MSLFIFNPLSFGDKATDYVPDYLSYLRQGVSDATDFFADQQYTHSWIIASGGGGLDWADPVVQAKVQRTAFKLGKSRNTKVWWPNTTHWLKHYYFFAEEQENSRVCNSVGSVWVNRSDASTG
eukprot:gene12018-23603_t